MEREGGGGQRSARATSRRASSVVGRIWDLILRNDRKPGKGFRKGCAVVRFASLEDRPGYSVKRNAGSPSGCEEARQEATAWTRQEEKARWWL